MIFILCVSPTLVEISTIYTHCGLQYSIVVYNIYIHVLCPVCLRSTAFDYCFCCYKSVQEIIEGIGTE